MKRFVLSTLLIASALVAGGETLRGPIVAELAVQPHGGAQTASFTIDGIVTVALDGDPRLLDAIEIELTAPVVAGELGGALALSIVAGTDRRSEGNVAQITGMPILLKPILRAGKAYFLVPLQASARGESSAAVTVVDTVVSPAELPLAFSVVPLMKGLSEEIARAAFSLLVRPVTRNLALLRVRYEYEDGTFYDPDSLLAPDFKVAIDGLEVQVSAEYLLAPGLHPVRLVSTKYEDRDTTIGLDPGQTADLVVPLLLSVATVTYTAPRGSRVYVDGVSLAAASGDFTVAPGEHTMVVVVGDYTVTRRFVVEERKSYAISLTMDIVLEETK